MDKWCFRAILPCGFQQIQGSDGVRIKIIKWDCRRPIVRGLRGRMDDACRAQRADQLKHSGTIAYIQFVMAEICQFFSEGLLAPARVALRAEKNRTLVIVKPVDPEVLVMKVNCNF